MSCTFKVLNHQNLIKLDASDVTKNTVIVIIQDNGKTFPNLNNFVINKVREVDCFWFDDVENESEGRMASSTDFIELASLVVDNKSKNTDFIISCVGGVSRSAAIAAAFMMCCNGSDDPIWRNGKYCPNKTIYKELMNTIVSMYPAESQCKISDTEVNEKEDINIKLWMQLNDM